jgi:AraC-like DNA-binding protein
MNYEALTRLAPTIYRFSDIDQFRSGIRLLAVEFTPLARKISAAQTILNLPGCDINFTQSFPRIVEAQLAPNSTAIAFAMDSGLPMRFNGTDIDRSIIAIGHNGAAYTTVERVARQYASIIFTPEMRGRGWPQAGPNWKVFETSALAHRRLRQVVKQILSNSLRLDASQVWDASFGMRESLVAAIDSAFVDVVEGKWSSRANSIAQFKVLQDIRAVLAGSIGRPVYSGELARYVGVPVRTMHDAVQRYHGMSLHRYLRIRRLWLVRQRLLLGAGSIKACALDCGFWHLGDFARGYRMQFGEPPSETVMKSRHQNERSKQ